MSARLASIAIFASSLALAQLPFSGFDHDDDLLLSPQEMATAVDEFAAGLDAFQATVMERFDSDGNGELSAAERQAMADSGSTNLGSLAARFDQNSDGFISADERERALQDFRQRLAAHNRDTIARFDADKDGTISLEERGDQEIDANAVLNAFGRGGFGFRERRMGPPDWVIQNDRDGDLLIDKVEEWFALEVFRDTMRERVSRQLDTDLDGTVSDEEIAGFLADAWREGREEQAKATLQRLQGVIDERLLGPIEARVAEWNATIRKRFDEDDDGWLNEAEARIARERLANEPAMFR
jgi:Ca2+-binding EF-hand superfamily protein